MGIMNYSARFKTVLAIVYLILALCFLSLPFSFLAFGSDIQTRQSTLYPYRSMLEQQDDFMGGNTVSGNIGVLGWSSAGTLTAALSSTANRPGVIQLDTTAVSPTQARINFGQNSVVFDPATPHSVLWVLQLNTNDANTTIRFGASNPVQNNPPTHGIYIEKLDADTNWFCVTRAGGVQTRTDSTVAVDTNFHTFTYTRTSSGVVFSIDSTSVCGTHTTNIPTTFIDPVVFIINSAAASKTVTIDYYQQRIYGLVR